MLFFAKPQNNPPEMLGISGKMITFANEKAE
jgi:hypothetical protein